jgi:hypothetical protein
MSWTTGLLTGMAEHLAAAGAGVWRPDGSAYGSDEVAIVIRSIPQAPDRLITLAPYAVDGTGLRGLADHQAAVQVRIRGTTDPRTCDETADAVFDALDSLAGVTWHGVRSSRCGGSPTPASAPTPPAGGKRRTTTTWT